MSVAVSGMSDDVVVTGWAARVMWAVRLVTQLVALNLLAVLGALAGAVVLGLAPSLAAAGDLATELAHGRAVERLWRTFWARWRGSWRRANLLAVPYAVIGVVLWLDLSAIAMAEGAVRATLVMLLAIVGSAVLVSACFFPLVVTRHTDGLGRSWRFLALVPLLVPATSLAVLVCLAAVAFLYYSLPLVAFLFGCALPLALVGRLAAAAMLRIAS